jgi:hypothetical protein
MRKPLVIYDFGTAPYWISLHMRKFFFSFLSVCAFTQRTIWLFVRRHCVRHTYCTMTNNSNTNSAATLLSSRLVSILSVRQVQGLSVLAGGIEPIPATAKTWYFSYILVSWRISFLPIHAGHCEILVYWGPILSPDGGYEAGYGVRLSSSLPGYVARLYPPVREQEYGYHTLIWP